MNKSTRCSPEFREPAVRLVFERQADHDSQWADMNSITGKVGYIAETLRKWVRRADCEQGLRAGLTTYEKALQKQLQRKNRGVEAGE